ncbi:MAG: LptF/LptG family permease [Planctomycetes bacterium]|nr:LptF/LptG family permease [Planctomycetota bacterium]
MPWILWRHMTAELLRVLLFTTTVIVVVIAFGAAIKPLADSSLGSGSVVKYVSLAMIPMLQFALPFSAGFAATLVMHRFTADNELVAMSSCGLRYRTIFAPVIAIGLILLVLMFVLLHTIVPRFWGRMQDMLAQDATSVFLAAVGRGEALEVGNVSIYADTATVDPNPPDSGAEQRLLLQGVAVVQKNGNGDPESEFTSEFATVDVHHGREGVIMKLAMSNGSGFNAAEGTVVFVPTAQPQAVQLGRALEADAKSMTYFELQDVRSHLPDHIEVQADRQAVQLSILRAEVWKCVAQVLKTSGSVELVEEGGRRSYKVEGGSIEGDVIKPKNAGGTVRVVELDRARPIREAVCSQVVMPFDPEDLTAGRVDLIATAPKAKDLLRSDGLTSRWPARIRGLSAAPCSTANISKLEFNELAPRVEELSRPESILPKEVQASAATAMTRLLRTMNTVDIDAFSHLCQRAALAWSAPLIVLLGASLAVWKRESLPLTMYLIAFVPGILNIVMIAGGQQVIRADNVLWGVMVSWTGNAILLLCSIYALRKLARN